MFSQGSDAVYALDKRCKPHGGVLLTHIDARSFLRSASPAVAVGSFLISVDGVPLDKFGEGRKLSYLKDQVAFEHLFWMRRELFGKIGFETCLGGRVAKHLVELEWKPEYERGVKEIPEPAFASPAVEFEQFGPVGG